MTKKLFLAAASVAALALAGGANAGTITGTVGGKAYNTASSYKVVSEAAVSAANVLSGAITAVNTLTNPINVAANAQRDHLVTFTVKGGTVSNPSLTGATADGSVTGTLLSNNAATGEVTFLVTVSGASGAAASATSLTLAATVTQQAAAPITVESDVVAVIGGLNIEVDSAPLVTAVEYSPLLNSVSAGAVYNLEASLPHYISFGNSTGGTLSAGYTAVNTGTTLHKNLAGDVASAADILDGATVTVKGPIINDDITVSLMDTSNVDLGDVTLTSDANTAVFTLSAADAATFASGNNKVVIGNNGDDAYRLGTYNVTWTPVAKTNFTVPTASKADSGTITLEGTNFTAPWVSGTGAATSVIRISNSNSDDSGAVTVRLISGVLVEGSETTEVAATGPVYVGVVPAGGDLQITSKKLVEALGAFTRGDIQVTINSDIAGFTAKMRNTRDGATFEQSLAD